MNETELLTEVTRYVEENIGAFHQKRISGLGELKLETLLKKKNPYLFRAKHFLTAEPLIRSFTFEWDFYLSKSINFTLFLTAYETDYQNRNKRIVGLFRPRDRTETKRARYDYPRTKRRRQNLDVSAN